MENLHSISTDKPSRLFKFANELHLDTIPKEYYKKYNIYITCDEEIKSGDYFWKPDCNMIFKAEYTPHKGCKKVILTTDTDLIKDGVQAIDDKFLNWFVENTTCEFVDVIKEMYVPQSNGKISDGRISHEISLDPSENTLPFYKIIIPQESVCTLDALDTFENARLALRKHLLANKEKIAKDLKEMREKSNGIKQETLEEAVNAFKKTNVYTNEIKQIQERMYSEEEVLELVLSRPGPYLTDEETKEWFAKYKKK